MYFGGFPFGDADGMPGSRGRGGPPKDVDNSKFYDILELSKDCTVTDVKKAYRKLAVKHHPDKKGGDAEKFKEISRAYEVLSDPEKRKSYDEYGEEGLEGAGQASDATDIFDLFFGTRRKSGKKKGEDVVSHLKVTLEQIYNGTTKKLAINKDILCPQCEGHGGPSDAMESCSSCNGQGVRIQIRQMGPMIQQTQSMCSSCKGQGKLMPPSKKCQKCSGEGTVKERKLLDVRVERGVPHQHKITFRGEADEKPGETPGDVIFIVDQQEHARFKRRGADLFLKKTITLYEALTGYKVLVKHLDGRELLIKSHPGQITKPNDVKAVKDEGMPTQKNPFIKGNLFIAFEVEFPLESKIDAKAQREFAKILPLPTDPPVDEDQPNLEIHYATEIDPESSSNRTSTREAYHEDEDEEECGPGGPKVQCRQQ